MSQVSIKFAHFQRVKNNLCTHTNANIVSKCITRIHSTRVVATIRFPREESAVDASGRRRRPPRTPTNVPRTPRRRSREHAASLQVLVETLSREGGRGRGKSRGGQVVARSRPLRHCRRSAGCGGICQTFKRSRGSPKATKYLERVAEARGSSEYNHFPFGRNRGRSRHVSTSRSTSPPVVDRETPRSPLARRRPPWCSFEGTRRLRRRIAGAIPRPGERRICRPDRVARCSRACGKSAAAARGFARRQIESSMDASGIRRVGQRRRQNSEIDPGGCEPEPTEPTRATRRIFGRYFG